MTLDKKLTQTSSYNYIFQEYLSVMQVLCPYIVFIEKQNIQKYCSKHEV